MLVFTHQTKHQRRRKKRNREIWILVVGTWLVSATLDLLFHACLLALSHSGRHESTTVCTLLLCAGPVESCSAVLAVRRYYGFRSLVCACWCSEEEKQVQKQKLHCLCSLEAILLAELMIQLALSPKEEHLPSNRVHLAVGTPRCHDLDWEERLCRKLATLTQTHARASCCLLLLCCCIAVGSGAATYYICLWPCPLSSSLVTKNEREKRRHKKQRKQRTSERFFSPTTNFLVGNYGLRMAKRWDDMPSMSSEI